MAFIYSTSTCTNTKSIDCMIKLPINTIVFILASNKMGTFFDAQKNIVMTTSMTPQQRP